MAVISRRWNRRRLAGPRAAPDPVQGGLDLTAFSWLTATVCAALLPLAPQLPAWFLSMLMALAALRWLQRRRRPRPLSRWLVLALTALMVGAVLLAYGTLLTRTAGTALLGGLLVLKLFEGERPRDACLTVLLAWFLLMAALLDDQSLLNTLFVSVLALPGLATLVALTSTGAGRREPPRQLIAGQLGVGAMLIVQALPLALVGFLLLPRLATPLWGLPEAAVDRTGLSERMSPGSMIDLLIDDRPAMRVSFEGEAPAREAMYWRALVLTEFDGRSWTRLQIPGQAAPALRLPAGAGVYRYEVIIEPTDTRWLPLLDLPLTEPQDATLDQDLQGTAARPVSTILRYASQSAPQALLELELDPLRRAQNLRLPQGFNPASRELAQRWRAAHPDDDGAVIDTALRYFREQPFIYTYVPPLLGRDSVDDFMSSTRAGFCEHYASAFAFLMRAAGIPTRVVIGYQGGFHNRAGNYWLLRYSDAHAWNESWLPGRGWVRVDPTSHIAPERIFTEGGRAAGRSSRFDGSSLISRLYQQFDRVGHLWRRAVLEFNAARQMELLERLGLEQAGPHGLVALLAVGIVLAMLGLGWMALRPSSPPSGDPLLRDWQGLRRRLARAGFAVPTWMGPRELAQRIAAAGPHGAEIAALCRGFEALRYAGLDADQQRLEQFRRRLHALRLSRGALAGLAEPRLNSHPGLDIQPAVSGLTLSGAAGPLGPDHAGLARRSRS